MLENLFSVYTKVKNEARLIYNLALSSGSTLGTIMLPIFQTSKITFLISPHYDSFGNSFSPFGTKILAA